MFAVMYDLEIILCSFYADSMFIDTTSRKEQNIFGFAYLLYRLYYAVPPYVL